MTVNQSEEPWGRWSIPSLDEHATSVFPSVQRAKKKNKQDSKKNQEDSTQDSDSSIDKNNEDGVESSFEEIIEESTEKGPEENIEESIEVVEEDTIQPFSADELLEIRKSVELEAYQSGFEKGEQHGFESGEKKAREEFEPTLEAAIEQIKILDKNINKASNELDEDIEKLMLDCIVQLTESVIRRELKSSVEDLNQLITDALSALPLNQGVAEIALNAKDLELLKEHGESFDCKLIADDSISLGSCRITTKDSVVDVNLKERISSVLSNFMGKPFDSIDNKP